MFQRTTALLRSEHLLRCDDSRFAFGFGPNMHGAADVDAVLKFFGTAFLARSIAGEEGHELVVTAKALHEIEREDARRATVQLLENDFRMFSARSATRTALEEIAAAFLAEMGECRAYSNTHGHSALHRGDCLGSWTPVTRSSRDTLLCFVSTRQVAYWVYADDE